jgi:glycerol-3-phosphate acyltransferase PlsY
MLIGLLLIAAAYLLGSVSTAIVACRLLGLPDPRDVGSGNPGATNVLRTGGRRAAAITLFGDMLKGLVPVALARVLIQDEALIGAVALAAFSGHLYPVYYRLRGGKGVATALGTLLGIHSLVALLVLAAWLAVAYFSRFASLASLTASALAPVLMLSITDSMKLAAATTAMSALIFWRHRNNIRQLLAGSENTIDSKT